MVGARDDAPHPMEYLVRMGDRVVAAPLFRFTCGAKTLPLGDGLRIVAEGAEDWGQMKWALQDSYERSIRANYPTHSLEADWTEVLAGRNMIEKAIAEVRNGRSEREAANDALDLFSCWHDELGITPRSRRSLLTAIRRIRSVLACIRLLSDNGVAVPALVFYEREWKGDESDEKLCDVSILMSDLGTDYVGLAVTPELDTRTRKPFHLDARNHEHLRHFLDQGARRDTKEWANICDRWNELHSIAHRPTEVCFRAVPLLERVLSSSPSHRLADSLSDHGSRLLPELDREQIYRNSRSLVAIRHALAHGSTPPEPHTQLAPKLSVFALEMCRVAIVDWLRTEDCR